MASKAGSNESRIHAAAFQAAAQTSCPSFFDGLPVECYTSTAMFAYNFDLLVILGPTASGKTHLGVHAAERFNGEIISADSRQVYRGMDIGTGKDLSEYGNVPYHLIDIVDPGYEFNVFEYQKLFYEAFSIVRSKNRLPILVGGTGLYIEAVIEEYRLVEVPQNPDLRKELAGFGHRELVERLIRSKPNVHNTTDLNDRSRLIRAIEIAEGEPPNTQQPVASPVANPLVFGVRWERNILRKRITARLKDRLQQGMIEEVQCLLDRGISFKTLEFYGLEYRFIARYLKGELNRNDMFQKLKSAIHRFAKRQETWFRRMERRGTEIHWLDGSGDPLSNLQEIIDQYST